MPDQDWVGAPQEPRPAVPDGSMPSYGSHPLPGMPGGDPPFAPFGWGPELDGDEEYPVGHGEPRRRVRIGLVVALLVICSVVVAGLIAVAASRGNDSPNSAPALLTASMRLSTS